MANYPLDYQGSRINALLDKIERLGPATEEAAGTMSAADKEKLNGVAEGAQANVVETFELSTDPQNPLTPDAKKITIPVDSAPTTNSPNPVSSGGVKAAIADFITKSVNDLVNYYLKSEVDSLIGAINQFHYEIYASTSEVTDPQGNVLYLIGPTGSGSDKYEEYVYANNTWTKIGDTSIDLSGYVTTTALNTALAAYTTSADLAALLAQKADKDTDAVEGNLAQFDASGNPVDSGVPASKIGEIDEQVKVLRNHDWLAEGIADTLSAGTAQQFTFRQSGGDGVNYMRRILGKTLVWNQLIENGNFDSVSWFFGEPYTVSDHVATVSKGVIGTPNIIIPNHKYLISIRVNPSTSSNFRIAFRTSSGVDLTNHFVECTSGVWAQIQEIYTSESNAAQLSVGFHSGNFSFQLAKFCLIDLTLMFGAGNEPSTVAEFEALYTLPYYAYNPGALISNDAAQVETVGFNQWDEEWEVGSLNPEDGTNMGNASNIRSKGFIPVKGGEAYFLSSLLYIVCCYDENKTFLRRVKYSASTVVVQLGQDVAFVRFATNDYGTTYNHDICINLSDPAKNGTYEPYWKRVLPLGLNSFRVTDGTNIITVNGLKSAGSVYDEIDPVGKKYIKRIGAVELGNLDWSSAGSGDSARFVAAVNGIKTFETSVIGNIICSKYKTTKIDSYTGEDKVVMGHPSVPVIWIKDTSFSNATAFKAAMAGVMLYYELATPIEYDLVDEIPNAILVDALGTEQAVFPEHEDGTPSAPFCCDSNYSISVKNLVSALAALNQASGTSGTRQALSKSAPQVEPEQEETSEETEEVKSTDETPSEK